MIECTLSVDYSDAYRPTYTITNTGWDSRYVYRARMFFEYMQTSSFTVPGYGLYSDVPGTLYEDWMSPSHPASIGTGYSDKYHHSNNFNTEIIVPIEMCGTTVIGLYALDGYDSDGNPKRVRLTPHASASSSYVLDGASLYHSGVYISPSRIIFEEMRPSVDSVSIAKIEYSGGLATVQTTTSHRFQTGDSITISGLPAEEHTMGENGARFMGTYRITVIDAKTFSYATTHYSNSVKGYSSGISTTAKAERWHVSIQHAYGTPERVDDDHIKISDCSELCVDSGEYVAAAVNTWYDTNAVATDIRISDSSYNNYLVLECKDIGNSALATSSMIGVFVAGHVPSASIPYNSSISDEIDELVENVSDYPHMANTFMSYPLLDTYFSKTDGTSNELDTRLIAAFDSVIAMKFPVGFQPSSVDGLAELIMYLNVDTISKCSVVMYQMTSNEWNAKSSYDTVMGLRGAVISRIEISNPSMGAKPIGLVNMEIPSDTIRKWLSNMKGFPASVLIQVITDTSGRLEFNSSETVEFKPYITLSGGYHAIVDPDQVDIKPNVASATPGTTIRVQVSGAGSFGDYAYRNKVVFRSRTDKNKVYTATTVSATESYIDVIVPDDTNGNYDIVVMAKMIGSDGEREVQLSSDDNDDCHFYVNGDPQSRNIKLADKIDPSDIDAARMRRSAVYNRDIAFSEFSEVTDGNSIIQNVFSILLTRRGERMFNPLFGTTLEDRLFSLAIVDDEAAVLKECISAVNTYEPRVTIDIEQSHAEFTDGGNTLHINLALILPGNVQEEIHLTFKNRGVEV